MKSEIIATGKYAPENRVFNTDLQKWMDTSDEWIRTRTGIKSRHLAVDENTSDLCIEAAKSALAKSGIDPREIGFIIVATMTPDFQSPSVACLVQSAIGASNSFAFDLNAACSGFVFALSTAEKLLVSLDQPYGVVVGGETMSKAVDWKDRSTAVLFGDGAGAVLLKKTNQSKGILAEKLHSDGSRGTSLTSKHYPVENPLTNLPEKETNTALSMDGKGIFDFAVRKVPENIRETAAAAGISLEEIDLFVLHQANDRILQIIAKKLGMPLSKFASNIQEYGNTSAGSIPILLDDCFEKAALKNGSAQKIMMTGFGGGLTWGSILYQL